MTAAVRRLHPAYVPHTCVVLAVDPGAEDGSAIGVRGELKDWHGRTKSRAERDAIVHRAVGMAAQLDLPLVAVVETWTGHGDWGAKAQIGLGERAGRWLCSIETMAPDCPILRVEPRVWRTAVLHGGRNLTTAQWKAMAVAKARGMFGATMPADSAEAVCMALWASRAVQVAEVLT